MPEVAPGQRVLVRCDPRGRGQAPGRVVRVDPRLQQVTVSLEPGGDTLTVPPEAVTVLLQALSGV